MKWESRTLGRRPHLERTKRWRAFGYCVEVTYERSPFVARWGYRPVVVLVGFLLAFYALRVTL